MIILKTRNLILRRISKLAKTPQQIRGRIRIQTWAFWAQSLHPPTPGLRHWLNEEGDTESVPSWDRHTHLPHQEWWFPVSQREGSPCLCNAPARAHFPRSCQRTTSHTARSHRSDSARGFPAGHTWHTSNHWKAIREQLVQLGRKVSEN